MAYLRFGNQDSLPSQHMYDYQPHNAVTPQSVISVKAMAPTNLRDLADGPRDDNSYPTGSVDDFTILENEPCYTRRDSVFGHVGHDFVPSHPSFNSVSLYAYRHFTTLARKTRFTGVAKATHSPLDANEMTGSGYSQSAHGSFSILNNLIKPAFAMDPICWTLFPIEKSDNFTYHARGVVKGQKSKLTPVLEPFDFKRVRCNEKIMLAHALGNAFHFKDIIDMTDNLPEEEVPSEVDIGSAHFMKFALGVAQAAIRTLLMRGILRPIQSINLAPGSKYPSVNYRALPAQGFTPGGAPGTRSIEEEAGLREIVDTRDRATHLELQDSELLYAELLGLTTHRSLRSSNNPAHVKSMQIQGGILSEMFFEDLHLGSRAFGNASITQSDNDYLVYYPLVGDAVAKAAQAAVPTILTAEPPLLKAAKTHYVQNRRNTSYNLHNAAVALNQATIGKTIATSIGENHDSNRMLDQMVNISNYLY